MGLDQVDDSASVRRAVLMDPMCFIPGATSKSALLELKSPDAPTRTKPWGGDYTRPEDGTIYYFVISICMYLVFSMYLELYI